MILELRGDSPAMSSERRLRRGRDQALTDGGSGRGSKLNLREKLIPSENSIGKPKKGGRGENSRQDNGHVDLALRWPKCGNHRGSHGDGRQFTGSRVPMEDVRESLPFTRPLGRHRPMHITTSRAT